MTPLSSKHSHILYSGKKQDMIYKTQRDNFIKTLQKIIYKCNQKKMKQTDTDILLNKVGI